VKLTKRNVKRLLDIETDADLSRYFGLTRGAAFFWKDDAEIPEVRQIALLKKRPDLISKVFPSQAAA
jgi:hypothetical protein